VTGPREIEVEQALIAAEAALDAGRGLQGTGFWTAVDAMRRDRSLAERYADRAAAIDRRAFKRGVRMRLPRLVGTTALYLATASGIALLSVAVRRHNIIAFVIGFGALLIGSHSLTHFEVGRFVGIRFTHVFLGGPPPPRPGMKIDYASYLRASRAARVAMHASGAIVTKLIPFVLLPFAWTAWLRIALVVLGVVQIFTDIFLSTKVSDWKKVRRELAS